MEDLAQYGTPLQSLDESNIHLSKAPKLSDQIVTDKQGKRRFHGAFTGGFSAGYFNSVGTKEGWTPATFVSSRSKRAEKFSYNPKAFMDEEDLDDFGIASQKIQASSDFEDPFSHANKRKKMEDWEGPIPGQPALNDLLKPVNLTVGMKFLIKLGWRPGQGIGPRLSRREKKKSQKSSRTSYVESASDSDTEDSPYESLSFAPDDVDDSLLLNTKSNLFGLGYKPLERTNVLGGNRADASGSFRMTDKKKKLSIRGRGFGVGAFEEDDDDIYMKEDMSEYDFDLELLGRPSPKKKEKSRWDFHVSLMGEVLEGFHISSKPLEKHDKAPLPSLPANYKPWHEPFKRRFDHKDLVNIDRLTSDHRRHIIGTPVVEVRSGVKKQEDKNEGDSVLQNVTDTCAGSLQHEEISKSSNYAPFAANPEKQKRYEAFISARGIDRGDIYPSYMTEWEKEREKGEFQRAQAFNRPLSFGMSSRFTSAMHDDCNNQLQEGLNEMKGSIPQQKEDRIPFYAVEMKEDMKAAKQKMFGRLTQCQMDWHPEKLLCKRFNVPNPFTSSTSGGVQSSKKEKFSIFSVLPTTSSTSLELLPESSYESKPEDSKIDSTEEETTNTEEDYGLKVPVTNPPTIDLFNAIFQDSSDSETEEDNKFKTEIITEETMNENSCAPINFKENSIKYTANRDRHSESLQRDKNPNEKGNNFILKPENECRERNRNSSPLFSANVCHSDKSLDKDLESKRSEAKGIFKGIDFSVINQYRSLTTNRQAEEENKSAKETSNQINSKQRHNSSSSSSNHSDDSIIGPVPELDEEEYGPALPPHMIGKKTSFNPEENQTLLKSPSGSSLLKEIERKLKKAKKQKKKHKHKHKKHKKDSKHRK